MRQRAPSEIDMNDMNLIPMHSVSSNYTKPPVVTRALLEVGGMTRPASAS
jgi:hypothetical protein